MLTTRIRAGLVAAALAAGLAVVPAGAAEAADPCSTGHWPARGVANTVATANPLDDGPWGVNGPWWRRDEWKAYCGASASNKLLLGKINSQPRMMWFGHWYSPAEVQASVRDYIANEQAGNKNVIVQLAVFRIFPGGEGARHTAMTDAQRNEYVGWINNIALGIGSSRVAVVLEPDLGIAAYDSADPDRRLALVNYATRKLEALPNTSVYLEASSADWLSLAKAADMLRKAGVAAARGFALGATHYSTLANEIVYAKNVANQLASIGIPGKKAVIDTSDNGRGFTYQGFYATYGKRTDFGTNTTCRNSPTTSQCGTWFDNAYVCTATRTGTCVTLGVPPTWQVARSGMSDTMKAMASSYVDGYTWFGRSWLYAQATPYKLPRALAMAQTTPYQ